MGPDKLLCGILRVQIVQFEYESTESTNQGSPRCANQGTSDCERSVGPEAKNVALGARLGGGEWRGRWVPFKPQHHTKGARGRTKTQKYRNRAHNFPRDLYIYCLLYTSDAADE